MCSAGWRVTYAGLLPPAFIESVVKNFYNVGRIRREVARLEGWNGWYVASDDGAVVGAGGGANTGKMSEIWVLYVEPERLGEGLGTSLLQAITAECVEQGAREQWVSVYRANLNGIAFYKCRGFQVAGEEQQDVGEERTTAVLRMRRQLS